MTAIRLRGRQDGPLVIDLPVGTVFRLDGQEVAIEKAKLALCRCGLSARKPLCDGGHKHAGFRAPAAFIETQKASDSNG